MALEKKIIRDRFDIAIFEIARLASQGYALVPLSVKMSGIVLYATMEINTDQVADVKADETKTEAKTETPETKASVVVDTPTDANPVTARVNTRTKKAKDA